MSEVLQAGIPRRPATPRGALLAPPMAAVVLRVHYADEPDSQDGLRTPQIRCDVRFTSGGGAERVAVLQHGYSITNGSLWVPQPAVATLSGEPLRLVPDGDSPATPTEDLDGEFVLVAFEGGSLHRPVILGALPRPGGKRPQNGHEPAPLPTVTPGEAENLSPVPDGNEAWLAHQGTVARIDRAGNLRVDLTAAGTANDGVTDVRGTTASGVVDLNLRAGATLTVRSGGVPVLVLTARDDGQVTIDLGKAASERAVLGERLQALFDGHRHPYLFGVTGAPTLESRIETVQADAARAVLSERVRLPAGESPQ